jgi:DNA end-binding protein Ku
MVMETLRYADEVNKAASYFRDIGDADPDEELLDLATTLIDKKTGKFDASEFHDRYVDALKDLIERKKKGKTLNIDTDEGGADPRGSNVVDLMAALKNSLGGSGGAKPAAKKPANKASGKKPAAKAPAKSPARKRA